MKKALTEIVAATFASLCLGDVFYWQGAGSWKNFDDPVNWSLSKDTYSNPNNLVPDADDLIYTYSAAKPSTTYSDNNIIAMFDMNGSSYSYAGYSNGTLADSTGWGWNQYVVRVKNGTLSLPSFSRAPALNPNNRYVGMRYYVESGGVLDISNTGTFIAGVTYTYDHWYAKSGGTFKVRLDDFRPLAWRAFVESGGTMVWAPNKFGISNSSYNVGADKNCSIENSGTLLMPNGFDWNSDPWGARKYMTVSQKAGTMLLGAPFTKTLAEKDSTLWSFTFSFEGGTIVASNSVSFFADAPDKTRVFATIPASKSVTVQVLEGSSCDMSFFTYGSGVTLTKTGPGMLILADRPASVNVTAGTLKLANAVNGLSGVTVQSGATILCSTFGSVVDGLVFDDGAGFAVDSAAYPVGSVIAESSDATLLEKIRAAVAAALPDGVKAVVSNGQVTIMDDDGNIFEAEGEADLSSSGWNVGHVPAGEAVKVSGASTIGVVSATTPTFESITVQGGATLKIADSNLALPPVTLAYPARLLLPSGVSLALTNGLTCVGDENGLPVLEVATNAVCTVPRGTKFKNVAIKLCGEIGVPPSDDTIADNDHGLSFGYASAGETTYFAMESVGGNINVSGNTGYSYYGLGFAFAEPAANGLSDGRVVAIGDIVLKDTTFTATGNHYIGKRIGGNNPENSGVSIVLDNTVLPIVRLNTFRAGTIVCRNGGRLVRTSSHPGNWASLNIHRYAKVVFEGKDSGLSLPYSNATTPFSYSCWGSGNYWTESHDSLVFRDGATMAVHMLTGERNANLSFSNGVYQVATLPFTDGNPAPPNGDPRNWMTNAFNDAYQVRIEAGGKLFFQSAHVLGGPEWDRYITLANRSITGAGDFVMTNGVPGRGFAATVVAGNNNATGSISVAPSADPTTLYFNDGANWAGTVVAGNVALTNLTAAAEPATVNFATLDLAGDFPIRIWKNDGVFSNDKVNISAGLTGDGAIEPVLMNGLRLRGGETFVLGTCPASGIDVSDPAAHVKRNWVLATDDAGGGKVRVLLRYEPRGLVLSFR